MSDRSQHPPALGASCRTWLWLVLLALLAGSLANRISPRRIPWVGNWAAYVDARVTEAGLRVVTIDQARRIVADGAAIVIDARSPDAFAAGHLPGAISLPVGEASALLPAYAELLTPDMPVMVYCSGAECEESLDLGKILVDHGCTNVAVFTGGYAAWAAAPGVPAP